jgi:intracellular multiplication protein IcmO
MTQYKGALRETEISTLRRRKDTRTFWRKAKDSFKSGDGIVLALLFMPVIAVIGIKLPLSGELMLFLAWLLKRKFITTKGHAFDFPYRVPLHAHVGDGSFPKVKDPKTGKLTYKLGTGISYLAQDLESKEQVYSGDSDERTHKLVLGTTGSGKTEFLLGNVANVLVQNSGAIYVDGKGDPNLQKEILRLSRYFGREDDLLIINFITSGRDFVEKQFDKMTNTMNLMSNTSSGMLIELIVSLLDDSGGSGDMWKGRAISFVASLTRPLIYLRDKGFINLSPEKYIEYFELNVIEELVWEHNGKYGDMFDVIVAPLRAYLLSVPGYQKAKMKKQEQKTLEQHGFIVMQLTRIFNDLTFNYGHIFKTRVGDVDFFDVVINRRLLVVLLPALERAPDTLRMLGKMIVGSIKQMMASCLGNRVEGMVREIISSRPTNAPVPYHVILDEYGYYAVLGFAVAPAQARSLGFAVTFAAQDFSSLKKSSAEEADATWENTNVRVIGRLTSGEESETWRRIQGAAGQSSEAMISGFERKMGVANERFNQQDNVSIERHGRLDYNDLAQQQDGEITLLIGKKEEGGKTGGVRVIRGMGFYTGGTAQLREMRINHLLPVEPPEPADLPRNRKALESLIRSLIDGSFREISAHCHKPNSTLKGLNQMFERNYDAGERPRLGKADVGFAVLGWFLGGMPSPDVKTAHSGVQGAASELEPHPEDDSAQQAPPSVAIADGVNPRQIEVERALSKVSAIVEAMPMDTASPYVSSVPMNDDTDEEIHVVETTSLIRVTSGLPMLGDVEQSDNDEAIYDQITVAERKRLLDVEMAGREEGFATLDEKFAAEDRIDRMRECIDNGTTYPVDPIPSRKTVSELRMTLAEIAERCRQEVKGGIGDIS